MLPAKTVAAAASRRQLSHLVELTIPTTSRDAFAALALQMLPPCTTHDWLGDDPLGYAAAARNVLERSCGPEVCRVLQDFLRAAVPGEDPPPLVGHLLSSRSATHVTTADAATMP